MKSVTKYRCTTDLWAWVGVCLDRVIPGIPTLGMVRWTFSMEEECSEAPSVVVAKTAGLAVSNNINILCYAAVICIATCI